MTTRIVPPPTPPSAQLVEKIPTTVYDSSTIASRAVAQEIADLIRGKAMLGQRCVLGLATGSTPTGVYAELVRMHREEGLSFSNVVTFNLDEYYPMKPEELQSYHRFMNEHLFNHVDVDRKNIHIPSGTVPLEDLAEQCAEYEREIRVAGGIDLQILGIGRTGHIGFNEPGSPRESRTRPIVLDYITRHDAAQDFFGLWNVPRKAITMGVESIMSARRVILMAWGEHKANVIKRAVEGEVTSQVAASFLQLHPNARIVLDPSAATELTRFATPWLIGAMSEFGLSWDAKQTRRAVVWLAQRVKKPLLKLTNEDYNEHGLQELAASRGGVYDINIEVFKAMQNTITGWPGGKPPRGRDQAEDQPIPHASDAFPKRVIIFSPHPDDDVISMGGTFIRLCDQGHDVHVAYQTSGNIAVFDDAAVRHADFVAEFARAFNLVGEDRANQIDNDVERFVKNKKTTDIDSPELRTIKALIRRSEARDAARYAGVKDSNIHFLEMPFYETGRARKAPLSEKDVQIVAELLRKVQPHQLYAAGDLADPHGTHRVCLEAILQALEQLKDEPWVKQCDLWLYRGAWHEFGVDEIEMAVPLSPDELLRKRMAILKHESQRRAMFAGEDSREFWQRAEDRNRHTAKCYDELGLPEYEAIEGFVKRKLG
jgi:glucosamine-6-phosphate deaminase